MSRKIENENLSFLFEESADDATKFIGSFETKEDANTFDALFAEAVYKL